VLLIKWRYSIESR